MARLKDYSLDTGNGEKPDYLVIYFHGYTGSGGNAAYKLSQMLRPILPNARIRCPDGPIHLGGDSYSWFNVEDMLEAPRTALSARRATEAAKEINKYIDEVIAEEGIDKSRVILAGFSQGGSMAYFAGLTRDKAIGGVYALSGGAMEHLIAPASMPPVRLAAGEEETGDYSGVPQMMKTEGLLKQKGARVDAQVILEQGHDLTPAACDLLAQFVRSIQPAVPRAAPKVIPPKPSL